LDRIRCARSPWRPQFYGCILIACPQSFKAANLASVRRPYDCKWFYGGNIELEDSYAGRLFSESESANLVFYLAKFDRFEDSHAREIPGTLPLSEYPLDADEPLRA
jgi:hypothetical protein